MARDNWESRIPKMTAELAAKLDLAVKAGAEQIARDAKGRVPVGTGKLRDAIHVDREEFGEYMVVAGDSDVFYGHLVELGTAHTPARPFLIPAAEAQREEVVAAIAGVLKRL